MGKDFSSTSERIAIVVGMLIYIAAVIFMGALTDTSIFKVFMGLLPTLLYLIAFFFMFSMDVEIVLLWLLPLLFPAIFIILWLTKVSDSINSLDGPVVAVINVLLSYFINIFLILILSTGHTAPVSKEHHHVRDDSRESGLKHELDVMKSKLSDAEYRLSDAESRLHHKESQLHDASMVLEDTKSKLLESQRAALHAKSELVVSKENFNITLRSIEDKCKAINFVIGRVYSEKKGASDVERSKLRIDSELYNGFSDLTADFQAKDAQKLYDILEKIYMRLILLESLEKDVLRLHPAKLPVDRDKYGNDRILDVMQKNDRDPILEYHLGAKVICEKLMGFLKKNHIDVR